MTHSETHFHGKVALKALIQNEEGKVLICMNSFPGEPWDLPGGTMNAGEHPVDALKREVKEELGIDIVVHEPVGIDHFLKRKTGEQTVLIMMRATLADPSKPIELVDGEISETRWIGKDELDSVEFFSQYRAALDAFFSLSLAS